MTFYDMHVHSTFSADGKSTLEEYSAAAGKTASVGFTEHVDFLPECGSFEYMDPAAYMTAVRACREKGFDFHAGAEIDYAKSVEQDIIKHLAKHKYEYTVCSIHMVDGVSVSDRTFTPGIEDLDYLAGVIENYYRELKNGIESDRFDVIGHIGVFSRYLAESVINNRRIAYMIREAELETAKLCAGSDMIVEVNTSGLFSPLGRTLPGEEFFKNYYGFGGSLVSLGSDAHNAGDIARGFAQAGEMLKSIGFDYLTLPWDRELKVGL